MGAIIEVTRHREGVDADGNRFVESTIGFSGTYATGGDTLTPATFGLTEVRGIWQSGGEVAPSPYNHSITGSNAHGQLILAGTTTSPLVQVWANGAQVANATNLTARQHRVRILGRG